MDSNKTVAEKLRGVKNKTTDTKCVLSVITGTACRNYGDCGECAIASLHALADMIEAEQAELLRQRDGMSNRYKETQAENLELLARIEELNGAERSNDGVDVAALKYCADYLDKIDHPTIADTIRAAIEGEIGELFKRPEPEVLDADGVKINVGDTVYSNGGLFTDTFVVKGFDNVMRVIAMSPIGNETMTAYGPNFTHRKPDTQEAIEADCGMEAYNYLKKRGICPPKSDYESQKAWKRDCRRLQRLDLLARQRKLLGGE